MNRTLDSISPEVRDGGGRPERVLIVGLDRDDPREWPADESLDELERLVDTAGGVVVGRVVQRRPQPHPRHYVGTGKLEEIRALIPEFQVDTVVFDDELTPGQARNLERELSVHIVDRTQVILDIFAGRAQTREGRLQVELAQLEYLLPRLVGKGIELSRLGGGIGTRGPGETKLETDRRRIRRRIADLKAEVDKVRKHRALHRRRRKKQQQPVVALVGYTNAGKSTLLSALTGAEVFIEDRLFATLDPTVRAASDAGGQGFLLVDTVGFINKLPHQLVAAFRATLEEVLEADLIVHVLDISSSRFDQERSVVLGVLAELGAGSRPIITACNKVDLLPPHVAGAIVASIPNSVAISAAKGWGLDELVRLIEASLPDPPKLYRFSVPYSAGNVLDWLHENGEVRETRYEPDAVHVTVEIPSRLAERVSSLLST